MIRFRLVRQIHRYVVGTLATGAAQPNSVIFTRRITVAIYSCPKCGMSVGTMTCGACGKELVHDTLQRDSGTSVNVAKCPDGHGKVKSPMCCGEDMSCSI